MPHRLLVASIGTPIVATVLLVADVLAAGWLVLADFQLDKNDITGSHGLTLCAVGALIVVWFAFMRFIDKENKRRKEEEEAKERRHAETIALYRENAAASKEDRALILAFSNKQVLVQQKTVGAIRWMAAAMERTRPGVTLETTALSNMADELDE